MGKAGANAAGGMGARFVSHGGKRIQSPVHAGNMVPTAVRLDIRFNCYNFRLRGIAIFLADRFSADHPDRSQEANMQLETPTITESPATTNVKQAVPFLMITSMEKSLRFYVDGLGFVMKNQWIDEGKLRWCWLQIGDAALMLQEYRAERVPQNKLGVGMSVCFQCQDALQIYREFQSRGIEVKRPFVGNAMWVTILTDPDGYKLDFESPTDAPEESEYSE